LLGRAHEWGAIEDLLTSVRDGLSGAIVLRGETGIGKTALLDHAVAAAADMRTVRLVGIESEMELGYAGLHQLLHPFMQQYDMLPPRNDRRWPSSSATRKDPLLIECWSASPR
jgi:hypothetical protein